MLFVEEGNLRRAVEVFGVLLGRTIDSCSFCVPSATVREIVSGVSFLTKTNALSFVAVTSFQLREDELLSVIRRRFESSP